MLRRDFDRQRAPLASTLLGQSAEANTDIDLAKAALELTKCGLDAAEISAHLVPLAVLSTACELMITILTDVQMIRVNRMILQSLCREMMTLAKILSSIPESVQDILKGYPDGSTANAVMKAKVSESRVFRDALETLQSDLLSIRDITRKLRFRRRFLRFLDSTADAQSLSWISHEIALSSARLQYENIVASAILWEMRTTFNDEERVLHDIPQAHDAEYRSAVNVGKAGLQEGTRAELLATLERWEEDQYKEPRSTPIFVLVGEAGTGKSTVAWEFCMRLEKRSRLGASFFFTRGVQGLDSPMLFYSTIASQFARSQPALRGPIIDAAREYLKAASVKPLEQQFESLVQQPLSTLPSSQAPIFVIIDALDECTDEGPELVPTLLRLILSAAAQPGSPLRVLFTSRPEPHYIHAVFTSRFMQPDISITSMQDHRKSVDSDIAHFIRARLAANQTSKRWSEQDQSIVPRLVKKSDGLFLYAQAAIDFILHDIADRLSIQERYELLLTEGQYYRLPVLETLFSTVLESVFPHSVRYAKSLQRLKRVLAYLVILQEPDGITPRTLEGITGMPVTESVPILNKLRSIVFFDRDDADSRFHIIHATLREFLVDPSRAGDEFYVDAAQAHGRLAHDCKKTIRSFVTEHWQHSTGATLLLQLLTQPLPELAHLPPLRYACQYLDRHHAEGASTRRQDEQTRLVAEDDLLPISSLARCLYPQSSRTYTMWDLVVRVLAGVPPNSPAQKRLVGVLSSLATARAQVLRNLPESDRSPQFEQRAQVAVVSIVLDIQPAPSQATSANLEDRHIEELDIALVSVPWSSEDASQLCAVLIEAHAKFHRAIISAGLTAGHESEEEYADFQRREGVEDTDTSVVPANATD